MNKAVLFIGCIFLQLISIGVDIGIIENISNSDAYCVGGFVLLIIGFAVKGEK